MNKRYYEHTLPIIRGSLSNTYLSRQGEIYILGVRFQFHIRSHDGIPVRPVLEYFCFHTIVQFVGCCIFHL
mgnify:CR=1 FL=1|jgi:hypothetical protein